jgi:hypothetical protein
MKDTSEVVRVAEAFAWIEGQQAIHLKAVARGGGPVTLTAAQARTLGERLARLAAALEGLQTPSEP